MPQTKTRSALATKVAQAIWEANCSREVRLVDAYPQVQDYWTDVAEAAIRAVRDEVVIPAYEGELRHPGVRGMTALSDIATTLTLALSDSPVA